MELFESASFGITAFFVFNYTLDLETNFNAFRNNFSCRTEPDISVHAEQPNEAGFSI